MENVVLRCAVTADADDISQCASAAYTKYIERMGKVPAPMVADFNSALVANNIVVACSDNKLLGYVVFYPVLDSMHLENVAVYPQYAGRGIGRKLIKNVEQSAITQGFQFVDLYTNEVMIENLAMYPVLGYEEYDRRREDGFNRVYFRKRVV